MIVKRNVLQVIKAVVAVAAAGVGVEAVVELVEAELVGAVVVVVAAQAE